MVASVPARIIFLARFRGCDFILNFFHDNWVYLKMPFFAFTYLYACVGLRLKSKWIYLKFLTVRVCQIVSDTL